MIRAVDPDPRLRRACARMGGIRRVSLERLPEAALGARTGLAEEYRHHACEPAAGTGRSGAERRAPHHPPPRTWKPISKARCPIDCSRSPAPTAARSPIRCRVRPCAFPRSRAAAVTRSRELLISGTAALSGPMWKKRWARRIPPGRRQFRGRREARRHPTAAKRAAFVVLEQDVSVAACTAGRRRHASPRTAVRKPAATSHRSPVHRRERTSPSSPSSTNPPPMDR